MLWLYRLLHILLIPLVAVWLWYRRLRGREDATRFAERLGHASQLRPQGPLVWVHGASVGEVMSTLPVLRHLRSKRPDINLLLTTGTTTGMRMLSQHAPQLPGTGAVVTQYVPLDTPWATKRFMAHWHPTLSIFTESDFWPELLSRAPHPILLNGRISDRSWPKYKALKWFFKPLISRFEHVLAQRDVDAERLKALGGHDVRVGGNLKFDADPLPVDEDALDKLRRQLGSRPVVVFASTHPGEEEQAALIHKSLKTKVPDLLTIIVPRHPHRGTQATNEILRHLKGVHRRGIGDVPKLGGQYHTDVYVADTLGELGLWYRLADVAVIGGSLVPHGGQNPLEPLKLGIITVTGPHMFNFKDMVPALTNKNMLHITKNNTELTQFLLTYLSDKPAIIARKTHIAGSITSMGGSSKTAADLIASLIPSA